MQFYDRLPILSPEEVHEELTVLLKATDRIYFIIESGKNNPIGTAYLDAIDWTNRNAELNVMVADQVNKKLPYGANAAFLLIKYAFNKMNMQKIYARTMDYAVESQKLLQDIPFTREAILRDYFFQGGRYLGFHIYGLLSSEFEYFLSTSKGQKYNTLFSR
jgi:RimJ/RimL family protein N-acetyltransferase